MVTGELPHLNPIFFPAAIAVVRAASVQLAAVPVPTYVQAEVGVVGVGAVAGQARVKPFDPWFALIVFLVSCKKVLLALAFVERSVKEMASELIR
jgi:hypothetical protein